MVRIPLRAHLHRLTRRFAFRIGLVVVLVVFGVVISTNAHISRSDTSPAASNGTAPPCSNDEYFTDGQCYSCISCRQGQTCMLHGASSGCHDCAPGTYDADLWPMTACVDCPSALVSDAGAVQCSEPGTDIEKILVIASIIVGLIGSCATAWVWYKDNRDKCPRCDFPITGYAAVQRTEDGEGSA